MSRRQYWRNRISFLLTNLICMVALTIFLLVCGNPISTVLLILAVWVLILLAGLFITYWKRDRQMKQLLNMAGQLSERYLISEVMELPEQAEDQVYYRLLKMAEKSMLEQILTDMQKADPEWNVILLRYFNPIGAHPSGTMGENPSGIPNNLMPYITQVAVGKLKELSVFGNDYDTPDGTGVRDYIHVMDLASGHVAALKKIKEKAGLCIYNLGTGVGYSVLDIVKNFEEANHVKIPYVIKPRRAGDIATCYADASKAKRELGWEAKYGIRKMCEDSWRWQKNNPNGYGD